MNLADLLFGAYRRDVLGLLLLRPGESYHVREIARITRRPANTLYRELALLAEAGLLVRRAQGNQVHYQANPNCPIYEDLRGILKKTTGIANVLREALAPLADRIKVAYVYGSIATGTERSASDVDLMVVGDVRLRDLAAVLGPARETLRREVNANPYQISEFRQQSRRGEPFLSRVLEGPKIFVVGSEHDLGKLVQHRQAKAA